VNFRGALEREWSPCGTLSNAQLADLERHYLSLLRWNRSLNLTRIQKLEDSIRLHYCESLYLGLSLPSGTLRIADIGSGGGFPGIPIAVIRPECSLTLIEAHRRKAVFLREAAASLANVRVVERRAEEVSEQFDWIVARAVAPKQVLSMGLAPAIAILTSLRELGNMPPPQEVRPIPWGVQRVIAMFHVELRDIKNARESC